MPICATGAGTGAIEPRPIALGSRLDLVVISELRVCVRGSLSFPRVGREECLVWGLYCIVGDVEALLLLGFCLRLDASSLNTGRRSSR